MPAIVLLVLSAPVDKVLPLSKTTELAAMVGGPFTPAAPVNEPIVSFELT